MLSTIAAMIRAYRNNETRHGTIAHFCLYSYALADSPVEIHVILNMDQHMDDSDFCSADKASVFSRSP